MKKKRSFTLGAGVAALALALAGLGSVASATPVDYTAPVTADLGLGLGPIGNLALPVTGGTFTGTVDTANGAISGGIEFPESTVHTTIAGDPPQNVSATIELAVTDLAGTIAGDGTVSATGRFHLGLFSVQSEGSDPMDLGTCNWAGNATMTGTFDAATNTLTVSQNGFFFEDTTDDCAGAAGLLGPILTGSAEGAEGTDMSFTVVLPQPEEPTTTAVPTTAVPTTTVATQPAAAAKPVVATPAYTG